MNETVGRRGDVPGRSASTVSRRLCVLLLSMLASVASAVGAQAPQDDVEEELRRCFGFMITAPPVAADLVVRLLARDDLDISQRIKALNCQSGAAGLRGERELALDSAMAALSMLESNRPSLPSADILRHYHVIGVNLAAIDEWAMALSTAEQASEIATEAGDVQGQVEALIQLGGIQLNYLDDPAGTEESMRRAISLASPIGRLHPAMFYNLGYVLFRMGRHDEAIKAYDNALDMIGNGPANQQFGVMELRIQAHRAAIVGEQGRTDVAIAQLEATIQAQARLPNVAGESTSRVLLGELLLKQDQPGPVLELAGVALDLARRGATSKERRQALSLQAHALARLGRGEEALAALQEANALQVGVLVEQGRRGIAHVQEQLRRSQAQQVQSRARDLRLLLGLALLFAVAAAVAVWLVRYRLSGRLALLNTRDALTGLLSRHEAAHRLTALAESSARGAFMGVLLVVDIDHLKQINDQFGNDTGDRVLADIARRLDARWPSAEVLARWSGDEFLMAMPCRDFAEACAIAESVRALAVGTPVALSPARTLDVTVSIGFVSCPFFPGDDELRWQDGMPIVDQALFVAKQAGRDAWAGIWGTPAGSGTPLLTVLRGLDRAQLKGWIEVATSRGLSMVTSPAQDDKVTGKVARALRDHQPL